MFICLCKYKSVLLCDEFRFRANNAHRMEAPENLKKRILKSKNHDLFPGALSAHPYVLLDSGDTGLLNLALLSMFVY